MRDLLLTKTKIFSHSIHCRPIVLCNRPISRFTIVCCRYSYLLSQPCAKSRPIQASVDAQVNNYIQPISSSARSWSSDGRSWKQRCSRSRGRSRGWLGTWLLTSHPTARRGSIFLHFMLLLRVWINSQTLKFHSPISQDPLNARWLRSLRFPKPPPL